MQPNPNSPPVDSPLASPPTEVERRSRLRGNPQYDLCNLLEAFRRRETLCAVALADSEGIVIAGAGSYSQCQELGARAPAEHSGVPVFASGQQLLLSFSEENAKADRPAAAAHSEIHAACERILGGQVRKPPLGLLR